MAKSTETAPSLPYHEPEIATILIQSSLLLLLNIAHAVLDRLLYCGLLAQVLIGIAWGTPGANCLSILVEEVLVQLGYLGLILLVYEGGLSTSFASLKANLLLSSAVALTGISVPIALSYTLQGLLDTTPLQAFAAGAALCSTSLGTTLAVLASSGLSQSRLGIILTSAAMMDDIVGLVMVQVVSRLGSGHLGAVTIVRPILVATAFAVVIPLACKLILHPLTVNLNNYRETQPDSQVSSILGLRQTAFALHTTLLLALVAGSTYAGTSNLFAAYIAGAVISWWDTEVPHVMQTAEAGKQNVGSREKRVTEAEQGGAASSSSEGEMQLQDAIAQDGNGEVSTRPRQADPNGITSGPAIYEHYYRQAVVRVLQPLFFASIGFSIPITRMFKGSIIWRGIVYSILMMLGKMVCGLWLVRFSLTPVNETLRAFLSKVKFPTMPHSWGRGDTDTTPTSPDRAQTKSAANAAHTTDTHTSPASKPISLHPPLILALAMTARGEIGFLISAVAESNGVFSSSSEAAGESDIFLVVTWAIVLCTLIGPLGVGLVVRRVKKLQQRKNTGQDGAGKDALGVWGVE